MATEQEATQQQVTQDETIPPIYLSDEKIAELKDAFGAFDSGTGKVSTNDLGTVIRYLAQHPTEAEIAAWMQEVDKNGSGTFEFDDFRNLMATKMSSTDPADDIRNAFIMFDKEGTGTITAAHLREIMTSMGEVLSSEEVDEMIQTADTDNDGIVHYEEFLAILLGS